jgi:hypothetical protein
MPTFIKTYQVANKVEVFNKIKEIHHRIGTAVPQILVSLIVRELGISSEEAVRHLDGLQAMDLLKFKGPAKGAVELTRSGLTTTMRMAAPNPQPQSNEGGA